MLVAWPRCTQTDRQTRRHGRVFRRLMLASAMLMIAPLAAGAETLDDSMNWALRSSFSVQADNERQAASEARLRGSIDAFMPTVGYVQEHVVVSENSYTPGYIL